MKLETTSLCLCVHRKDMRFTIMLINVEIFVCHQITSYVQVVTVATIIVCASSPPRFAMGFEPVQKGMTNSFVVSIYVIMTSLWFEKRTLHKTSISGGQND